MFSRASAPIGDTFQFSLNEPARVTLYFDRFVPGRKLRAKCVAPTRRNHGKPPCKRPLAAGAISFTGRSGLNKAFFAGRLSQTRKLALGRYRLTIVN